jgi:hypothetical protein
MQTIGLEPRGGCILDPFLQLNFQFVPKTEKRKTIQTNAYFRLGQMSEAVFKLQEHIEGARAMGALGPLPPTASKPSGFPKPMGEAAYSPKDLHLCSMWHWRVCT